MAPKPKRRRQATASVVPRGPNHQLNVLREQLDAQVKAEATLETTEDTAIQDALENDINVRNSAIAETLAEFLHDPFTSQLVSDFSNEEKYALRRLRHAVTSEGSEPSDDNKNELMKANGSLVRLLRPKPTSKGSMEPWVPTKYRLEEHQRAIPSTNLPVSVLGVEGALEWRPRHKRDKADLSLYKVENPDIKHPDPIDQGTWDTVRNKQSTTWRFESTDDELGVKKKERSTQRKKKKKKKKRQPEDRLEGEQAKKRKGEESHEHGDGEMQVDDDQGGGEDGDDGEATTS